MNERDFFYWLQGYFELTDSNQLSEKQVQVIREHMALVAKKETKSTVSTSGFQKPVKVEPTKILNLPTCLTC